MKFARVLVLSSLFAAIVAGLPSIASAANFGLRPRSIATTTFDRSATLTLVNQGDVSIRLAVAAMHWVRSAGKMRLTPTDDLLVFPPIVTLAPHEKRLLPVTVLAEPSAEVRIYRLLVTELGEGKPRERVPNPSQSGLPVFFRTVKR